MVAASLTNSLAEEQQRSLSVGAAGVTSQVGEVQALSLTTIAQLRRAAGPAQVQPYLVQLTTTMLESLSGMEVSPLSLLALCCAAFC